MNLFELQDLLGWHTNAFVFIFPTRPAVMRMGLTILNATKETK